MPKKVTLEEFINRANIIHQNKYQYTNSVYITGDIKVSISCSIHGEFLQKPYNHLQGQGCMDCALSVRGAAQKENKRQTFEARAREIHGDYYDYSQTVYKGSTTKVKIGCPKHGIFMQSPSVHLRGHPCRKCSNDSQSSKLEDVIKKANKTHNNFYSYEKFVYKNCYTKAIITCPLHGDFEQIPANHLFGAGCMTCGYKRVSTARAKDTNGWKVGTWKTKAETSNIFDSFKVYLLEMTNENEHFYKIGRTYRKVTTRTRLMPYKVTVLHEIKHENAEVIFDLEHRLKREYRSYKYVPKLDFDGKHECFSELPISDIIANYPTNYVPPIDDAPTFTP